MCAPTTRIAALSPLCAFGVIPSARSLRYALESRMKKITSKIATFKIMIGIRRRLQKNGTLRIKPISNGGSPTGVRHPPILDTRKIKNTTTCVFLERHLFARINGRIITMLAPVVPIQLDNNVPIKSMITFTFGDPLSSPSMVIFPATQKSPNNNTIKVK